MLVNMDFVDISCFGLEIRNSNEFLGALNRDDEDEDDEEDDDLEEEDDDEEEVDFEDDDLSLFSGEDETETLTCSYTNDGSVTSYSHSQYTSSLAGGSTITGPLMARSQATFQKTTPLFDAIDQHYWDTVEKFLTTGQWDSAGRSRLPSVPLKEEARQWSVTLDKSGKVTSRRLPIHAATVNNAPLKVMAKIIDLYPNGASCADSQGNLPLHLAFQHGNSLEVIKFLLEAYPEAVLVKNNSKKGKANKGFLPMECANELHNDTKLAMKLCQEKAKTLRDDSTTASLIGNKIMSKLRSKSPPNTPPVNKSNPNDDEQGSDKDLIEIQNELNHLRRAGSSSVIASKDSKNDYAVDGWMRTFSENFQLQGSFLGGAMAATADDEQLPAIEEGLSGSSQDGSKISTKKTLPVASNPALGRWKESLSKLGTVAAAATARNTDDEQDNNTQESFEVNLTSRSALTSASNKSKKRFSFSNPFARKNKKTDRHSFDTVTVQSSNSRANLSVSRFSLSAVKDDTKSVKSKSKTNRSGSIFTLSGVKDDNKSLATKSNASSTVKSKSSWFQRAGIPKPGIKEVAQEPNSPSPSQDSQNLSHDSITFIPEEEKTNEGQQQDSTGGTNAFATWTVDKHDLVSAMSKMMLANAPNITNANTNTSPSYAEEKKTPDVSDLLQMSRSKSSTPAVEEAELNNKKDQGFTASFLKLNEHSFLENSLLLGAKARSGSSRQQPRGRGRRSEDETSQDPDDISYSSSGDERVDTTDGTSTDESVSSQDEDTGSSDDVSIAPAIKSSQREQEEEYPASNTTASIRALPALNKAETKKTAKASRGRNLVRRLSQPSKKKRGKSKAKESQVSSTQLFNEVYKSKRKFGLFARRASKTKRSKSSSPDPTARESSLGGSKARVDASSLKSSGLSKFVRQNSWSSRHSQEESFAKLVLPQKGDWRSDYEEFLAAQAASSSSVRRTSWTAPKKRSSPSPERSMASCAEDILQDLESSSSMLRDGSGIGSGTGWAASFHEKDSHALLPRSTSGGPVVSESTVKSNTEGNVYLVRVQF